jgi:hypothetical protein
MQRLLVGHISHIDNPLTYHVMLEDDSLLINRDVDKTMVTYNDIVYNQGIPVVHTATKTGIAYKARLEGVSYSLTPPETQPTSYRNAAATHTEGRGNRNKYKHALYKTSVYPIKIYVEQFLKKSEFWVLIEIIDIDKYKRLIIRIYDPITQVCLNEKLQKNFGETIVPFFGKNGKSRLRPGN